MLYCKPEDGFVSVTANDEASALIADYLNTYLDNDNNLLDPSTSAPLLNPREDVYHKYAMAIPDGTRYCEDYDQPYGCP